MQDVVTPLNEQKRNNRSKEESFDAKNIKRIEKKHVTQIELARNTRRKEQFVAALVIVGLLGLTAASFLNNGLHLKEIVISSLIIGGIALVKAFGQSDINEA